MRQRWRIRLLIQFLKQLLEHLARSGEMSARNMFSASPRSKTCWSVTELSSRAGMASYFSFWSRMLLVNSPARRGSHRPRADVRSEKRDPKGGSVRPRAHGDVKP